MAGSSQSIAFAADMHIAPEYAGAQRAQSSLDRPHRRKRQLEHVLKDISAYAPQALFFGGDNTNEPIDTPGYAQELASILANAPKPWKIIPGNHDIGSTVGWHHHNPASMQQALASYQSFFGCDYWIHEAAGFQVIGINSQLFGSSLDAAKHQEQQLEEQLGKTKPSGCIRILFMHTPPYLKSWEDDFTDGSQQMCLTPQARISCRSILEKYPPDILLSAHAHRFWMQREPLWWWIGLPSTALPLDEMTAVPGRHVPPGENTIGWVSLERTREDWITRLHPLDGSLPT